MFRGELPQQTGVRKIDLPIPLVRLEA